MLRLFVYNRMKFVVVVAAVHLQKPPMVHAGAQNVAALQQQVAQQPPSITSGEPTNLFLLLLLF